VADLAFRVQHVIKTEIDVTQAQLNRNGIDLLFGVASFVDANTVRIESSRGAADYCAGIIIIATGTKPAATAKVPINGKTIINRDRVLQIGAIPKTPALLPVPQRSGLEPEPGRECRLSQPEPLPRRHFHRCDVHRHILAFRPVHRLP
jgi:hypothetical protein